MDHRTDRNIPQRQAIADLNRRIHTRAHGLTRGQTFRRDDVTTLTVCVKQERYVRGPIRVVFKPLDLRRDAVLPPIEVDHAVMMLVPAPAVANRNPPVVVATGVFVAAFEQGLKRPPLVQLRRDDLDHATTAWRGWFCFDNRHV